MTRGPEEKSHPGCGSRQRRRRFIATAAAVALLLLAAARAGASSEDPLWTDKPVRIDRSRQTYERLAVAPIPIPLRIPVTSRATVFDSASFETGGRLYVLHDIVPVDPVRVCRSAADGIAVCGQQARIALRRRIAGRVLSCEEDFRSGRVSFVTCRLDGRDLAETLVAAGAGWAATPRLQAVQEKALHVAAGIWRDPECRRLRRCPPGRGR